MHVRWAGDRVVAAGTVLSEACRSRKQSFAWCAVARKAQARSRARWPRSALLAVGECGCVEPQVAPPVRVPVRVIVPAGPDVHVDPEVGRECLVGDVERVLVATVEPQVRAPVDVRIGGRDREQIVAREVRLVIDR